MNLILANPKFGKSVSLRLSHVLVVEVLLYASETSPPVVAFVRWPCDVVVSMHPWRSKPLHQCVTAV